MSIKVLSLKVFGRALKTIGSTAQILLYFVALLLYFFAASVVWIVTIRLSAEGKVM